VFDLASFGLVGREVSEVGRGLFGTCADELGGEVICIRIAGTATAILK
jgi:hypothetical protein